MIATLFDYGAGNLHSLAKALAHLGATVRIEEDPRRAVADTQLLVLPGVGAFGPAAQRLAPGRAAIRAAIDGGLPVLGICLGMQLLFDGSDEGPGEGLGIFAGRIERLAAPRVPHMGWAEATGLGWMYFAHSYAAQPAAPSVVSAWTQSGPARFPAAVRSGRVLGVQFHPEKSSAAGLSLLRSFLAEVAP